MEIRVPRQVCHPFWNPTVFVFSASVFSYAFFIALGFALRLHDGYLWPLITFANVVLGVLIFTPLHDACHGSASSDKRVNQLLLSVMQLPFLHSPWFFKKIHLIHHSNVNEDGHDPDHFTAGSSWTAKWLRSFVLIYYYYYFAFFGPKKDKLWRSALLSAAVYLGAIALMLSSPWALPFLFYVILPNFIAIGVLGFINTAWPHHPAEETSLYRNTRILHVPYLLQVLMCNQNYHLIHHLRPTLPWYRYREFWRLNKELLRDKKIHEAHWPEKSSGQSHSE